MARMDALELLAHDHRIVEQLFRDWNAAASDEQKHGLVDIMIRELSKHAAVEELMVYPLAKEVLPDGDQLVRHQLDEHMTLKRLLVDLDKNRTSDPKQLEPLIGKVKQAVEEHVRDEEGELMPKMRERLDEGALEELGDAVDKAKDAMPTRTHPNAPEEPPALALAGPVAAIYDRLRDRLQGRPKT